MKGKSLQSVFFCQWQVPINLTDFSLGKQWAWIFTSLQSYESVGDVSPLNLERASAELKFCTTLLVFQATQFLPHPSKLNKFNQPKVLLQTTAKSLRENCEFTILFVLLQDSLAFTRKLPFKQRCSLLLEHSRFECKTCLWITVISWEVLCVSSGSVRAVSYCHLQLDTWESSIGKTIIKQGLEGRAQERKICWKLSRELWAPARPWRRVAIPLGTCTSLQTGLGRHTSPSPGQHSTRVLWWGFEHYVCVGCIPRSQSRKG